MATSLHELKLELTQQCPLACVHCSTDSHKLKTSALPEKTVFRLLSEASALGVEKVAFSGGEPLLASYLPTAVRECSRLGIHSSLYTCGVADLRLNPLGAQGAAQLAQNGLGRFIFSLYSLRPDVHNSVTRLPTFTATVTALRNAVDTGARVEIHFVAMRRNFRDLPGLVEAASHWGVRRLSVLRFVPHGRGGGIADREDLTTDEMHELREMIIATRLQFPDVILRAGSPYNILGVGHTPCDAAIAVLAVNHRGQIFPCDAFKNVQYHDEAFGSVLDQPLKDIWEKSAFLNRVREELAAGPMHDCGSCAEFSGCKSGCLAQKVIREGWVATSKPDPSCLVQIAPLVESHPEPADVLLQA
ncbi:MAG TPA: radical SAM protein [Terriglobales bacterium]|nr:radical SAM protein [Terriglobales bacterium]